MAVHAQTQEKPSTPKPPPPPKVELTNFTPSANDPDIKKFLKENTEVASIYWSNGHTIVLKMKDKTVKPYDLSEEGIRKNFIATYGEIPDPPPPPPPPPAKPQKVASGEARFAPPKVVKNAE